MLTNADHVDVIGFGAKLPDEWDGDVLEAGQRVHVSGTVENRLAPGRYVVKSWVHQEHSYSNLVLHTPHLFDFVVFGAKSIPGVMSADAQVGIRLEEDSREH
jgi:hypothetical protein